MVNNVNKARKVARKVWLSGFTAICPHLNTDFEDNLLIPHEEYLKGDLEILIRCNVILMLENWENSKGARQEHDEAHAIGIPILYSVESLEAWYKEIEEQQFKNGL